jgi:tetratricopeptide (TPR) repeat protein
LIDALDELDPKTRELLLADFEDDNIESRLLIDGVWWAEANLESPNWNKCLQVFDKTIEKTVEWGYPHIAAASARGKAIIHDEYLNTPDTAHEVLQDITSKIGSLPMIEEERALVYFHQQRYQEALHIYENILPKWDPPSEQVNIGPLEEYRRAAICAANLDDWKKAACFFEEGAKRTQKIENTERYIGGYADAGFAHFKAGNMLKCIKQLHLALENFETLPQNITDVKYYTLKKRLEHTIKWIKNIWYGSENQSSKLFEPSVGFCSDQATNKEISNLPDCPLGYSWFYLSQIEYRFGHETEVFQHALQTKDREDYPILNYWLSFFQTKYEFRNKTFDNLPQRIYQLAQVFSSMKKHQQSGRGAAEKGSYSISGSDLSDFASVDNITAIFIAALIVLLRTDRDTQEILTIWRTNSSELPIKANIYSALDLIEPILLGDYNDALTVMHTPNEKVEKLLAASIRVIHNAETSLEDLLFAHTYISSSFIESPWEELIANDLVIHISSKWQEKIKFRAKLKTPMITVPQIEKACKSSETGKKKNWSDTTCCP